MKGVDVNLFIDHVSLQEAIICYKGKPYFLSGVYRDQQSGQYELRMDEWDDPPPYTFVRTVFEINCDTPEACMKIFLTEPIVDGKSFWEMEKDIEWIG